MGFLFPRRGQEIGTVGLHERPDGIAVAGIGQGKKDALRIAFCEFLPDSGAAGSRQLPALSRRETTAGARGVSVLEPGGYHLLQIEMPEVPAAETNEAVRWLIKDLLDFPFEEAVVDHFQVPNQNRGRARLGYAVAARQTAVRRQADLLRAARLRIGAVDIPEMALHNLASLLPEREQGVAFIYPGRQRTLITVSRNGTLFLSRALGIGTDDFLSAGNMAADAPSSLAPSLQDLLNTIILETQRSLDFYESQYIQAPVAAVVVAPLEFPSPALIPYFREYLGARVRSFDFADVFADPQLPPGEQARLFLAVGAALRREVPRP